MQIHKQLMMLYVGLYKCLHFMMLLMLADPFENTYVLSMGSMVFGSSLGPYNRT